MSIAAAAAATAAATVELRVYHGGRRARSGRRKATYVGINMWQAVRGLRSMERLRRELDVLSAAGIRVLLHHREFSEGTFDAPLQAVPSLQPRPGVFDTNMAGALDLLMDELWAMACAILVPNNMWTWSGGFATYLTWAHGSSADWREIPYPSSHLPGYWDAVPPSERPTRREPTGMNTKCGPPNPTTRLAPSSSPREPYGGCCSGATR